MKKLIALQITLILLLTSILSACSGEENANPPETSDVISTDDEISATDEKEKICTVHAERFRLGENDYIVDMNYDYTIFGFSPSEEGIYIITGEDGTLFDVSTDGEIFGYRSKNYLLENVNKSHYELKIDFDELVGEFCWFAVKNDQEIISVNIELSEEEFPVNRKYFDLYNEKAPEQAGRFKTHDYCYCGAHHSRSGYEYRDAFLGDKDFIIDYGYATEEEYQAYAERVNEVDYANADTVLETGWTSPPPLYIAIKEFNIKKEDYLEHREKLYEFYLETGLSAERILSEREIEILFGDYDLETVMRELKLDINYYYNGGIFTPNNLYRVSDELLKEMMKEDDFYLYLFDMENLGVKNPSDRVEALKAEMEAE